MKGVGTIFRKGKNLRAPGLKYQYTKEEAAEFARCAHDPIYFIENYVKVRTSDKGMVLFKLYDYQKRFVTAIHENRFTVANLPRQVGKSACVAGYILWLVLFNQSTKAGILANKQKQATQIFRRIKTSYENLPMFLQQGVRGWSETSFFLENGSSVMASATSKDSVRGDDLNFMYLDEFAHIRPDVADDFFISSYPTISAGQTTKLVITSTPNGLNRFHRIWVDANRPDGHPSKNRFIPISVRWNEVPEYPGGPNRGEKFKRDTIAAIGESRWMVEYECSFIGNVNTLISSTKLSGMVWEDPMRRSREGWYYFRNCSPDRAYCVVVDVSKGVGKDYTAMVMFDTTEKPYKVVASWQDNTTPVLSLPGIIAAIGKEYNTAWVLIETNDQGARVASDLHRELEYENILMSKSGVGRSRTLSFGFGGNNIEHGVYTTHTIKKLGCNALKNLVENDQLLIPDERIVRELQTFVSTNVGWEADVGSNDDLAMCCVLFGWLSTQQEFKDVIATAGYRPAATKMLSSEHHERTPEEHARELRRIAIFEKPHDVDRPWIANGVIWFPDGDDGPQWG